MSSLNKWMSTFLLLLLLTSPIPIMASKRIKLHGTHQQTKLHDQQSKKYKAKPKKVPEEKLLDEPKENNASS